jgi:hypothetical protein
MKEAKGFLALTNRYVLEGKLISEAPLHIGGEPPNEKTDAPFLGRMFPGLPFVE